MVIVAIVVFVLLLISVPIGIALSGGALAYILFDPLLEPNVVFRAFFNFITKYTLMAIPLFIFAGFLMERTGLVSLLFRFADALVGWLPGGFGIATILACVIFAAISGSSVAMAAAMSVIAIPEMLKRGYPPWVAGGARRDERRHRHPHSAEHPADSLWHRHRDFGGGSLFRRRHSRVAARSRQRGDHSGTRLEAEAAAGHVRRRAAVAGDPGRGSSLWHAGDDPWRTLRGPFHAHRGCGRGMRLCARLRRRHSAHGFPARAARGALPFAESHRGDPVFGGMRRRIPVSRRESLLAADHHEDRRFMGTFAAGLHLRLHRAGDGPWLLRGWRGDDPAHHP